jgi:hypothetical protein
MKTLKAKPKKRREARAASDVQATTSIRELPTADLGELSSRPTPIPASIPLDKATSETGIATKIQPLIDAAQERGKAFDAACAAVRAAREQHKAASKEITAQRKQLSDRLRAIEATPTGLLWDYGDTLIAIKAEVGHGFFEGIKKSLREKGLSRTQMGRALAFRVGYATRAELESLTLREAERRLRMNSGTDERKCDFESDTLSLLQKAAKTARYDDLTPPEQQLVESLCAAIKEGQAPEHDLYTLLHGIYGQSPEQAAKCVVYVTLCVLA